MSSNPENAPSAAPEQEINIDPIDTIDTPEQQVLTEEAARAIGNVAARNAQKDAELEHLRQDALYGNLDQDQVDARAEAIERKYADLQA